jgi:hypothetical protein
MIEREYTYDKIEKVHLSFDFDVYNELNNIIKHTVEPRSDGI